MKKKIVHKIIIAAIMLAPFGCDAAAPGQQGTLQLPQKSNPKLSSGSGWGKKVAIGLGGTAATIGVAALAGSAISSSKTNAAKNALEISAPKSVTRSTWLGSTTATGVPVLENVGAGYGVEKWAAPYGSASVKPMSSANLEEIL